MKTQCHNSENKKSLQKTFRLTDENTSNLRMEVQQLLNQKSVFEQHKSVGQRISNLKVECPSGSRLTTWEIAKYRQSKFEIVLKEMLMKGYHRSFSTLFNINLERERKRLAEGPDSTRWKLPSLENHPQLNDIKVYLCMVEDCQRSEEFSTLLTATGFLIDTFGQQMEDMWIVQQFVNIELECSNKVMGDSGQIAAIANLSAGINAEKSGDYDLAAEYLARVFSMSYSHNWTDAKGQPILKTCSEHLCQVYLNLAYQMANKKPTQMLSFLKQAHEISKEAGLKSVEATCCLELGNVFEKLRNFDMAIAYYRGLFEVSHNINDQYKLGLANEAMARCYESRNNKTEAIRYMEKFVSIAEKSCNWPEYARACRVLGETYNRFGDYEKARIAFANSYLVTYCLKTQGEFNESKILKGVAVANNANTNLSTYLAVNSRKRVETILEFKTNTLKLNPSVFCDKLRPSEVVTFRKRGGTIESRKN